MKLPPPNVSGFDGSVRVNNYLVSLVRAITSELIVRPSKNTPVDSVLLVSPNGAVYTVAVADDGTLTTTKVRDA